MTSLDLLTVLCSVWSCRVLYFRSLFGTHRQTDTQTSLQLCIRLITALLQCGIQMFKWCAADLTVTENVHCFGSSCFPVAFAIPAILMLIAIGRPLLFLYYLKYCTNDIIPTRSQRCFVKWADCGNILGQVLKVSKNFDSYTITFTTMLVVWQNTAKSRVFGKILGHFMISKCPEQ